MPTSKSNNNIIGITLGDPAGIGPEVIVKAIARLPPHHQKRCLIIGDRSLLAKSYPSILNRCPCHPVPSLERKKIHAGHPTRLTAQASLDYLDAAIRLIKQKKIRSIVTAPLSKEGVSSLGKKFQGHTEYLAAAFRVKKFGMMFVAEHLRTMVITRHIPLKQVCVHLTTKKVSEALSLTHTTLKKFFKIRSPHIAVCGLNPHAGEGGTIGQEEITTILPAIRSAKRRKINVSGPFPADTLFSPITAHQYDAIIAMYHDQGLIALKTAYFRKLVNLTVGLPFVRTSPAHGTAYNIAGQNKADPSSMYAAIKLALELS